MNVFTYGYMPFRLRYPKNLIHNIKQFFKNFKYAYQRATKGYCDQDVWNLDCYYTQLLIDTITKLADITISFPGNEEFPTYESWIEYLRQIVTLLKHSQEDDTYITNKYQEDYDAIMDKKLSSEDFLKALNGERTPEEEELVSKWCEDERRVYAEKEECRKEAFKMINRVFHSLWD